MSPYWGVGTAFGDAAILDQQFKEARKALLQPGIQVESIGSQSGLYGMPFACLRVTFANATNEIVVIRAHDISQILQDPAFPPGFSEVRTTLCLAKDKAVKYQASEQERMQREADENFKKLKAKIKSGLKRFLPF